MPPLLSCQSVSKSYSSRPLFREISFAIDERERLGLIGPNGAGKSTLLKLLSDIETPDSGVITTRKGLRVAYIAQEEHFPAKKTIVEILDGAVAGDKEEHERHTEVSLIATQLGFENGEQLAGTLSGGWRKRLSIACQLIKQPDLLLLDEPTNHLDVEGVLWLEELLRKSQFSFVVTTHDRAFLENVCTKIFELNPAYADGYLSTKGGYSDFLIAKEQYMGAQANLEQSIASKVRREIAWLQRGARARQTKAQARIQEAGRLIESLAEVKFRNAQNQSVDIDFNSSGRRTKELLVAKHIAKSLGDRKLFSDLSFVLTPGTKLGLLGANGTGKTTLLKLLADELTADHGSIKRADGLLVVVFDQDRKQLDQSKTLREALCPSGDSVVYRGRSIHVASWSQRFLFRPDQLSMPINYLSGGEQARILIANLMLRPADILILDEPTNDLDIASLEVLEDSLEDFPGAVVLVTHDRYMLDTVSNQLLALDGTGNANFFSDYAQWEKCLADAKPDKAKEKSDKAKERLRQSRKLSTNERRELSEMGQTVETAEQAVKKLEAKLTDPVIASNHVKLQSLTNEIQAAKDHVAKLYQRWQDLEARQE